MDSGDRFLERVGCGSLLYLIWEYLFGDGCGCALFATGVIVVGAIVAGLAGCYIRF